MLDILLSCSIARVNDVDAPYFSRAYEIAVLLILAEYQRRETGCGRNKSAYQFEDSVLSIVITYNLV